MVTKYDAFEIVYKSRSLLKPIEVVKKLNKDEREYQGREREDLKQKCQLNLNCFIV